MKKYNSQDGFAHLIMILVVAVGLVAGAGYYVWTKQRDTTDDNKKTDATTSVMTTINVGAEGLRYTLPRINLAIVIPSGWTMKEELFDQNEDGTKDVFTTLLTKGGYTIVIGTDNGGKGGGPSCNDPNEPAYEAGLPTCPTAKIVSAKQLNANACLVEIDTLYPDGSQKRITKWEGPVDEADSFVCATKDLGVYDDGWGQYSDIAIPGSSDTNNIPARFGATVNTGKLERVNAGLLPITSVNDATYKEAVAILSSLKNT